MKPSFIAKWLLSRILRAENRQAVLGDFDEIFSEIQTEDGLLKARLWYWRQILRSLPAFFYSLIYWSFEMLRNYLKVTLRNILKQKTYSFVKIVSLCLGLTSCLLIALYLQHELSYDQFHENSDQIYRVALERRTPEKTSLRAVTPFPLAQALRTDFPEVKHATNFYKNNSVWVRHGDKTLKIENVLLADSSFFDVFTVSAIQGNLKTALSQPGSIVITKEVAHRFFGSVDALGKVLIAADSGSDFRVTGVVENFPATSHFRFDVLVSFGFSVTSWLGFGAHSYVVLNDGVAPDDLEAKFPAMVRKYAAPQLESNQGMSFEEYESKGYGFSYFLQPLTNIHLYSDLERELEQNGNITYIYLFSIVGLLIMILACVNFMNLSTARSTDRAKEIGMRKVMGSGRGQIIKQFLMESVFLSMVALLLSYMLVRLILPEFSRLTGIEFEIRYIMNGWFIASFLGFSVLAGILAGSYPAFFLSRFLPIQSLKGQQGHDGKQLASRIRNGLVIFQFSVSIALMVATAIVYAQVSFMQNKELGFDKEGVVVIGRTGVLEKQAEAFKQVINEHANVLSSASASSLPGTNPAIRSFFPEGGNSGQEMLMYLMSSDYGTMPTLGLKLNQGRNFSQDFSTDSDAILLNESAVKALGWAEPLGQRLQYGDNYYTVIGIVEDFNFYSLHQTIKPLVIRLGGGGSIAVRISGKDIAGTMTFLRKTWESFVPEQPFEYAFLDNMFDEFYRSEQATGRLFTLFTALAILIAVLGLFGLAAYSAQQRTKEIGIRKVLGASVSSILILLSRDFLKLVAIAVVIGSPVVYFVMDKWLQDFAYRIDIPLWTFLAAGTAAFVLAFITIGFQSIKAALAQPVDTLRHE